MNKSSFIVAVIFIFVLGLIIGYQNNKIKKLESQEIIEVYIGGDIERGRIIDSLQNRCDSLYDELFIRHIENGRYETTFEHLKEVNPKLGKEMEDWMTHETE